MHKIGRPQIMRDAGGDGGGGNGGSPSSSSAPSSGTNGAPSSPSSAPASPPSTASTTPSPSSSQASPGAAPASPSPGGVTPPVDNTRGDGLFQFPDDIMSDADDEGSSASPTPTPSPTPEAPAQVPPADGQPKPTGDEPAAPTPDQPPATPAQTPPTPGPQEPSPPPSPAEPARIAEALLQNEDALIKHLAETEFKLSKEDLEALEADAPAHIPTLLARNYFKGQVNLMQQLNRVVPAMVTNMLKVTKTNEANEDKFWNRWPDLKKAEHQGILMNYARIYRQANPGAKLEQMVEDLGPVVMMAAKVQPKAAAPGAPVNGTGGRQPQPTPFKPASGGPAAPPAIVEENQWAGMAASASDED